MKKVLLISYHFPPSIEIGARRPFCLAKYLPQFGWTPIILTCKRPGNLPNDIRILETDYKDILSDLKAMIGLDSVKGLHEQLGITVSKKHEYSTIKSKFIKFTKEIIAFPDDKRGWYKYALKSASQLLDKENVNMLLSTSPPEVSHIIAAKLKQKYKIPWIADLRDPWTQDPNYNKSDFIKCFDKRLELKTLSSADAIVTVTEPWVDTLKELHKDKNVLCVTNGFDKDEYPVSPFNATDKFTIIYTGLLYNGNRDPSPLLKVLNQLIDEGKINKEFISINLYTHKEEWLVEEINRFALNDIVNVHGLIPREEVIRKQRESQVLLLLLSDMESKGGLCPAKLYEYLGCKRPIIAFGKYDGVVKSILEETLAGKFSSNETDLKRNVLSYYNEYIDKNGLISSSDSHIDKFNYQYLTNMYSTILNSLLM